MAGVDFGRYKRIMQYLWNPELKDDDQNNAPIWCLGKEYFSFYHKPPAGSNTSLPSGYVDIGRQGSETMETRSMLNGASAEAVTNESSGGWPVGFLSDFESRFWFTYRSNFRPIPKSVDPAAGSSMTFAVRLRSQLMDHDGFTSDTGWGCMIRSGQSLLANALGILRLGRDWRRGARPAEEHQLLALFLDDPRAPYSIHRFVQHGAGRCGKHPGEWFGPSATAQCIRALTGEFSSDELSVYLTDGADVYEDTFLKHAIGDDKKFKPVLILIGIRLGIERVTPVYWEALKASLHMPQSVGIAGGSPSSSHYFVGSRGDQLFFLDPHQTRPAIPYHEYSSNMQSTDVDSYHTSRLRRIHIRDMDPSMLIGFLVCNERGWQLWKESVAHTTNKAIIHIAKSEPTELRSCTERASAIDEVEAFDDEDDGREND